MNSRVNVSRALLPTALLFTIALPASAVPVPGDPSLPAAAQATASACLLGQPNASTSWAFWDFKGLSGYVYIDPKLCSVCPSGALLLDTASWHFRYQFCPPSPLTFEISVVGAIPSACPAPDTTEVLCGPTTFVYQPGDTPPHIATLPIPAGCCVQGPAFVRLHCVDSGGCGPGDLAFFAYGAPCSSCSFYFSAAGQPLIDFCALTGTDLSISVTADCCAATPVHPRSWGRVKVLYR